MKAVLRPVFWACVSLSVSACGQSQMAEVFNKGSQFFGRDNMQSQMAMRMPQDPMIAGKYHSQAEFATPASVDRVAAVDLPPPTASAPPPAQPIMQVKFSESVAPRPVAAPQAVAPVRTVAAVQPAVVSAPLERHTQLVSGDVTAPAFIWPTEGSIISGFGPKPGGLVNDGINIAAAEGKPIWAAAAGEVVYAGNGLEGYGNMVILRHESGYMTAYAHAADMLVSKGMRVEQGDLLGYVGKTGSVQSAQLHFGIRRGKEPVNPESMLPRRVASAN